MAEFPVVQKVDPGFHSFFLRGFWRFAIAGTVMVFFSGSVALAQTAMPGGSLYSVKLLSERVLEGTAPSKTVAKRLTEWRVDRRLSEADHLLGVAQGTTDGGVRQKSLEGYQQAVRSMQASRKTVRRLDIARHITAQQEALTILEGRMPVGTRGNIAAALHRSVVAESDFDQDETQEQAISLLARQKIRLVEERLLRGSDRQNMASDESAIDDDINFIEADVRLAEADAVFDAGEPQYAYALARSALRLTTEPYR